MSVGWRTSALVMRLKHAIHPRHTRWIFLFSASPSCLPTRPLARPARGLSRRDAHLHIPVMCRQSFHFLRHSITQSQSHAAPKLGDAGKNAALLASLSVLRAMWASVTRAWWGLRKSINTLAAFAITLTPSTLVERAPALIVTWSAPAGKVLGALFACEMRDALSRCPQPSFKSAPLRFPHALRAVKRYWQLNRFSTWSSHTKVICSFSQRRPVHFFLVPIGFE